MKFKDFEIRHSKDNKYEIIKWFQNSFNGKYCIVIGWIIYDSKDQGWDFEGCGLRYQKYCEDGLNEFVIKSSELLDLEFKYKKIDEDEYFNK